MNIEGCYAFHLANSNCLPLLHMLSLRGKLSQVQYTKHTINFFTCFIFSFFLSFLYNFFQSLHLTLFIDAWHHLKLSCGQIEFLAFLPCLFCNCQKYSFSLFSTLCLKILPFTQTVRRMVFLNQSISSFYY